MMHFSPFCKEHRILIQFFPEDIVQRIDKLKYFDIEDKVTQA